HRGTSDPGPSPAPDSACPLRAGPGSWDASCRFWQAPRSPRIGLPIVSIIMPPKHGESRRFCVVYLDSSLLNLHITKPATLTRGIFSLTNAAKFSLRDM